MTGRILHAACRAPGVHHLICVAQGRSPKWPGERRVVLREQPTCEACGSRERPEVHHVVPFHRDKKLELVRRNLVVLCWACHFTLGHLRNWKSWNVSVRHMAADLLDRIAKRP